MTTSSTTGNIAVKTTVQITQLADYLQTSNSKSRLSHQKPSGQTPLKAPRSTPNLNQFYFVNSLIIKYFSTVNF